MSSSIEASAEAFAKKFAEQASKGRGLMDASPEARAAQLDEFSKGFAGSFLPDPVSFGMGPPRQTPGGETLATLIKSMINRYCEVGLGFDSTLKSHKVLFTIDNGGHGAGMVEMVFTMKPHASSKLDPYDLRMFYGYRKLPTGEEGWECGYIDDEIAQVTKRVPDFYAAMAPPPQ